MTSPGAGQKILVVEDEPIICEICLKVLTEQGYAVDIASNGHEGAARLEKQTYDLVIIDARMPLMDGKQLYQHILQQYPQMADRVLMTSGEVVGGDMYVFLEESGVPFLAKPFTPGDLRKAVEKAIGNRQG